jgi:hypothetical protein
MKKAKTKRFVRISVPLAPEVYDDLHRQATTNSRTHGKEAARLIEQGTNSAKAVGRRVAQ